VNLEKLIDSITDKDLFQHPQARLLCDDYAIEIDSDLDCIGNQYEPPENGVPPTQVEAQIMRIFALAERASRLGIMEHDNTNAREYVCFYGVQMWRWSIGNIVSYQLDLYHDVYYFEIEYGGWVIYRRHTIYDREGVQS
jgi:hypothetical protein